jgi:RimJ/RimL family protein N-acetyltransferase
VDRSFRIEQPSQPLTELNLTLRPFDVLDAEMIERVRTDVAINRWMSLLPRPADQFLDWAEEGRRNRSILFFAICEDDGPPLGGVAASADDDFRAGLGYWLLPEGRGRGLATRALRRLSVHLLEETACKRCELWVDVENTASRRVAERAGFRFEGVLRSYAVVHQQRVDAAFYSLLPADVGVVACYG